MKSITNPLTATNKQESAEAEYGINLNARYHLYQDLKWNAQMSVQDLKVVRAKYESILQACEIARKTYRHIRACIVEDDDWTPNEDCQNNYELICECNAQMQNIEKLIWD